MLPPFVGAIGTDRHLTADEVIAAAGSHPELEAAWRLYRTGFDAFCETRLDPMFHTLDHPARTLGSLRLDSDETVLVVGTGPSAVREMRAIARARAGIRLFTSPRGALLLAQHGLVPDLVLVEHRTALDAHHSARQAHDGVRDVLGAVPLVAADWRTPAGLLNCVSAERLFVPDPLATWGLWPATAVALAVDAGAGQVALAGVDLGTGDGRSEEFAPLAGLLALLARLAPGRTFDCGAGGAAKAGWTSAAVEGLASGRALSPLEVNRRAAPTIRERRDTAAHAISRLGPVIRQSRRIQAHALAGRAGLPDVHCLRAAAMEMLSWRHDSTIRRDAQEALGASFLPRLWRLGIDPALDAALWRPLLLASHELVGQADRLAARTSEAAA